MPASGPPMSKPTKPNWPLSRKPATTGRANPNTISWACHQMPPPPMKPRYCAHHAGTASAAKIAAASTPIIGTKYGYLPELVREAETGFLVDSVEEAAEATRRLDEIERFGRFARRNEVDQFAGACHGDRIGGDDGAADFDSGHGTHVTSAILNSETAGGRTNGVAPDAGLAVDLRHGDQRVDRALLPDPAQHVRGRRLQGQVVSWHGRSEAPPFFRPAPAGQRQAKICTGYR